MPEFKDVAKASKDLFKKPFNAGKVDIDIKTGAFTFKNSIKGGKLASSMEYKAADMFFGQLGSLPAIPLTKKYDGQNVNFECKLKQGDIAVDLENKVVPATGDLSSVVKAAYSGAGLIAGVETNVCKPQELKFHATKELGQYLFGVSGSVAEISKLNYVLRLPCGAVVETDLKKYDLHFFNKPCCSTAVAINAGWTANASEPKLGVAVKKALASGADLHVKSDLSGAVDIAHVSNVSGIKLTLSAATNALNFQGSSPTFGAGLEFSF
jgi:hypothetical protein